MTEAVLAARSLGAILIVMFSFALLNVSRGDFDPEHSSSPEEAYLGIVPFLSYLVLAWWLLFR